MALCDRKVRWFPSYGYNMVRVLERLAEMVEERGGFVEHPNEELEIRTRGYSEKISDLRDRIEYYEKEKGQAKDGYTVSAVSVAIEKTKRELADLEWREENAPRIITKLVSCVSDAWIEFEMDGYEYAFYPDCNPFFLDMFVKYPVGVNSKFYFDKVESGDKDWLLNGMFEPVASYEVIDLCAEKLLEFLEKQKPSKPCDFMVTTA